MSWANRMDIDRYLEEFSANPVLGPAARFLKAYQETIDSVSDGWPYWSAGTRPAGDLCKLLADAQLANLRHDGIDATAADVAKAIRRVRAFMTRRADVFKGARISDDPQPRTYMHTELRVRYE